MVAEIDAVITWVDGTDRAHRKRREQALVLAGYRKDEPTNATDETRFANQGEIYYCIASILKYAPFIRRIFIVSDGQVPAHIWDFAKSGICGADRIRIVDHRTIFKGYEAFLPTFNSLTIESMLWRIPGLAETFLYFNDDVFLNAPLSVSDLVSDDGKLVVYGKLRSIYPLTIKHHLRKVRCHLAGRKVPSAHFKTAQAHSARLLGLSQYIEIGHIPHILRRSAFADFFKSRPHLLKKQLEPKFRTIDQFSPTGLSNHCEFSCGNIELRPRADGAYLKPRDAGRKRLSLIAAEREPFGCVQSLDEFSRGDLEAFRKTMLKKFGEHMPRTAITWMDNLDNRAASRQREFEGAVVTAGQIA
jgi:hypothetical protein